MANVLVIEDNAEISELIRLHMEDLGHHAECAADGKAGLAMAQKQAQAKPFDLIVLDRMLPCLDGIEELGALRKSGVDAPVLM